METILFIDIVGLMLEFAVFAKKNLKYTKKDQSINPSTNLNNIDRTKKI